MHELLSYFAGVFVLAWATGILVYYGVHLLDFCMHFPNPFWKVRYWLAKRYTKKPDELKKWLEVAQSAPYGDKAEIMQGHYEEIAAANPGFKRWICTFCLSTFVGIFVAGAGVVIIAPVFGWWSALYFWAVFPVIGFLGKD